MGKHTGFKEFKREAAPRRNPKARLADFHEIYAPRRESHLQTQGARCMDCGVPFCQSEHGCPIHNLIPEWNDLVYRGRWRDALDALHKTNNFPEFTGRVCPAPCESACVLGITDPPVTIKDIECAIIDRGFDEGWVAPQPPLFRTGKKINIIGSGPAGLAAAAQLNTAGHHVRVYERADRIGGLLIYGIPNMKLDKSVIARRVNLMREEGVEFIVNADVGRNVDVKQLLDESDALLLATGAGVARDLHIPGRDGAGVHLAMEFLTATTKSLLDSDLKDGNYISAKDKDVIVIGGGDTGADCIATALRHGCRSLVNFELLPQPPAKRAADNPWPLWPNIYRAEYAHTEAAAKFGDDPRAFSLMSQKFLREEGAQNPNAGRLTGIVTLDVDENLRQIPGTEKTWPADLILLAMGFLRPEHYLNAELNLELDEYGNFRADNKSFRTSLPGVYAAADCRRGQDLVVRAINEGREVAREIDRDLMGNTQLP